MKLTNILKAGLAVGLVSVLYNLIIFSILETFPSLSFGFALLDLNIFLIIFLKNFLVGMVLTILFSAAYKNIVNDTGASIYSYRAIFYFVLYGMFALVSFTIGDLFLMKTSEGMLLLLTLDGFVEAIIATIPIRIFVSKK
ncbi:MAG: hypothetical protein GWP15_01090 [Nitrospirae bacterium]|nr:hypothetical protein [Nitrospirota bacterium]